MTFLLHMSFFCCNFAAEFTPKPCMRRMGVGSLHIEWRLLTLCI